MIISTIVVLERTIVDSDVLSNCAGDVRRTQSE